MVLPTTRIWQSTANAVRAFRLLVDHGCLTVYFAGMPPGTSSLLVNFIPPETLERFGGADAFAKAVDSSVDRLAAALHDRAALSMLLLRERRAKPPAGNG